MPKKIENPLYSGLPARIYFHCYIKPQSGYSLAMDFYGKQQTDKIYNWINSEQMKNYISKTEDGYSANITPLMDEFSNRILQYEKQLTKPELSKLKKILQSRKFKDYVYGFYKNKITHNRTDEKQLDTYHRLSDFNAFEQISEIVGMVCTLVYRNRKFVHKAIKENEKKLEEQYKKNMMNWNDVLSTVKQFNEIIPYFLKFSDESLIKFSVFWPESEIIIMTEYVNFHKQENKK